MLTFGPSLLHARNGGQLASRAAVAAIVFALGAGWLGLIVTGFLLCAIAAVLRQAARMLRSVEGDGGVHAPPWSGLVAVLGCVLDLVLILLILWSASFTPWETVPERAFAPVLLLLLVRLVPRVSDRAWTDWVKDRALLSVVLAIVAGTGTIQESVQVLTVLLALGGILIPGRK